MKSFDLIAPFYGVIKILVFGRRLNRAEEYRLNKVGDVESVLVFGGGTGRVLEHPFFTHTSRSVLFVDASGAMLKRAEARAENIGLTNVTFLHGTQEDLPHGNYELILCPFILDVFGERELSDVVDQLASRLADKGQLVVTDFTRGESGTNKWLVPFMYWFFRAVGALSVKDVAPIEKVLLGQLKMCDRKFFLGRKVASWVFVK